MEQKELEELIKKLTAPFAPIPDLIKDGKLTAVVMGMTWGDDIPSTDVWFMEQGNYCITRNLMLEAEKDPTRVKARVDLFEPYRQLVADGAIVAAVGIYRKDALTMVDLAGEWNAVYWIIHEYNVRSDILARHYFGQKFMAAQMANQPRIQPPHPGGGRPFPGFNG